MTKQIKEYLEYLNEYMAQQHSDEELLKFKELLLIRISFYQHERLIHLLVTLAFALFFLLTLFVFLIKGGVGLMTLAVLFLVLLIPYIKHYYFLENSVQQIYKVYYRIENICK